MRGLQFDTSTDLVHALYQGRVFIIRGVLGGFVAACALMLVLSPRYEARMIVGPPGMSEEERSLTVLNANPSALPVTSVSGRIPASFTKFQQTYREPTVARALMKDPAFVKGLNGSGIIRFWPGPRIKNAVQLSDYIGKHVSADPIGATSSLTFTYRHADADYASEFLRRIYKTTDDLIRAEADKRAGARIAYMKAALNTAMNPEHRMALARQLVAEERQLMMIRMDEPYSAELIEAPFSSADKAWPRASVIFPLSLFSGALCGFLFFCFFKRIRQ